MTSMDATEIIIKNEFLQEADEIVAELDLFFLDFERSPNDLSNIDRIFRLMHTLIGSGMAAGFTQLGEFAHGVEGLLSMIRGQTIKPSTEIADLLLRSNDLMARLIKAVKVDFGSTCDTSELLSSVLTITGLPGVSASPGAEGDLGYGLFDDEPTTPPPKPASVLPAARLHESTQQHILVCDDDLPIVELLCEFLSLLPVKVTGVSSAAEAMNVLNASGADLIITDLRMPEVNGIDFIRIAKQLVPRTPVIFVSGCAERADLAAMCQLGAYDFIDKPISHERLTQSASNALRLKVMRDGVDELSRLNFRAYLLNSKLVDQLPANDQVDQTILAEITSCLDRISSLTRHILGEPATVLDASKDLQA